MKKTKKVLCLVLALAMLLPCCTTVLAATDSYDHYPQIYVTGISSANIYYEDDPEQKSLFWPMDMERILGNLGNIDEYIISSVKNGEPDILYTVLYSFLMDSFGMLAMGDDGATLVEGVAVQQTPINYKGDGEYEFLYDSRLSPLELAGQLKTYIARVKADSGSDKIELISSSYGTTVVMAYLHMFGDDLSDIDSLVFCVPTVGGVNCFSEIFAGEFNINSTALRDFVEGRMGSETFGFLLSALKATGTLDMLLSAMVVPALREAIFDALTDFIRDALGTIPAIWTCIKTEYLEDSLANVFGSDYRSPEHPKAALIEKIYAYDETIMQNATDILEKTRDNNPELHIAIICKYNVPSIPLSSYDNVLEDGLVTVTESSFGATCAPYGETLGKDYTQALYPEYDLTSPDGLVDASTCVLPFTTFFIRDLPHMQKNTGYWDLVESVAYRNLDVFTDEAYPQFTMVNPANEDEIIPVSANEDIFTFSFIGILKMFFAPVFDLLEKIREWLGF